MIEKNYSSLIDWLDVSEILLKDDILIPIAHYYIFIRKCDHFIEKIRRTVNYLKYYSPNNWFLFFYGSSFSKINSKNKYDFVIPLTSHDITLISTSGEVLRYLDYIYPRDLDNIANDNVFMKALEEKTRISTNKLRKRTLKDAGISSRKFLNHKTIGSYFIDASSSYMAGMAYSYTDGNIDNRNYGYGRGWNYNDAYNIASLESVERYVSQYYAYNPQKVSQYSNFNCISKTKKAYSPFLFNLEQNSKVTNNTYMYWTVTQSMITGKHVWIPEDLVVYNNVAFRPGYQRLINDSSNGVALAGTYAEAVIDSLLELIERHSFLAMWFGNIPGRKLSNFKCYLNDNMKYTITNMELDGYKFKLFEISVIRGVFVVWSLIINDSKNSTMYSYSAAGSGFTLQSAIDAALKESIVGMSVYFNNQDKMPKTPDKISTLEDHVKFYGNRHVQKRFKFTENFSEFNKSTKSFIFSNINMKQGDVLHQLIKILSGEFKDVLIANLTSKKLKENGLYAVKAIVPGMYPMTFGDNSLRININSINNLRKRFGLPKLKKIRKGPHPFP